MCKMGATFLNLKTKKAIWIAAREDFWQKVKNCLHEIEARMSHNLELSESRK